VSRDSQSGNGKDGRRGAAESPLRSLGDELLKLPVRLRGAELGRPTDVLVDLERLRVVGLQVRCGDRAQRFLPLAAAVLTNEEITASSSLALLDESAYYSEHGSSLQALRGTAVDVAGRQIGTLDDIVLRANGDVTRIVVKGKGGELRRFPAAKVRIRQRKTARRRP
jgi:hypothetical protein